MLDLTSLVLFAGLFIGLVVGDAALFGDTLQVQIAVPAKVAQTGFTEAAAEQIFAAEVTRIGQVRSPFPAPSAHMSSRPSVLAAIGNPLNLDSLVVALQDQAGIDAISVSGAVVADATSSRLDLLMVISPPNESPTRLHLTQQDGDANRLVERAVDRVLAQIMPFRYALADLTDGLTADAKLLARAKQTAAQAVAEPWIPQRATEQVLLYDVLAILALLDGNATEARTQFAAADSVPQALPLAHDLIMINRAFLAVAEKRPAEARADFEAGIADLARVPLPDWPAKLDTLHALVDWSGGDVRRAEQLLRYAATAAPQDETPHAYLARLLTAKGDAAGAEDQRKQAARLHRPDIEFAALAQSLFWVDPVNGGMRRRN